MSAGGSPCLQEPCGNLWLRQSSNHGGALSVHRDSRTEIPSTAEPLTDEQLAEAAGAGFGEDVAQGFASTVVDPVGTFAGILTARPDQTSEDKHDALHGS